MTIKKVNPGDRQISAGSWNEMRDFINNYAIPQNTYKNNNQDAALINVKNVTGGGLDVFAVVKIANPTYSNRTSETEFKSKGAEFGVELNGETPSSDKDTVAIMQQASRANGIVKAIASGCTPAMVQIDDGTKRYKYAKPIDSITGYLKATDETTDIRILWHQSGSTGVKPAYVCLDAAGAGDPLRVASKMVNTDTRPEGAFYLDTTDTWLYADAIDSIAKTSDSDPPAIANPCGYPIDRPVIIGKCIGFNGIEEQDGESETPSVGEESTEGSTTTSNTSNNPEPEAVAIACDVREFFMINEGSTSTETTDGSNNNLDENYSYGALEYISYDSSTQRWTPYTGTDAYKYRLAVCQRDLPANWSKEFRMPYQTPEMNYGAQPWTANDEQSSASASEQFEERCGVEPGEHEFTNKRLDYHYANGRYSYEPRFIFIGEAKAGSNSYGVAVEIEGNDYDVNFPTPRSATSHPDIYAGDTITVEVDARGAEPVLTAIDYPMDFAEDTVILTHNGKPGRGWEDVTYAKNNGDLTAGNGDILVWDKANDKIIAEWTVHQCTCSGGAPSSDSGSSGGGGHTCSHGKITPVKTQAKWWKKVKYDGNNNALL